MYNKNDSGLVMFPDEIPEDIVDFNLGADDPTIDHDQVVIAQATKLLQVGYLEYEANLYGSAYYQANGEIFYFISSKESTMEHFFTDCYHNNIYPTPAKFYFKRYDLLDEDTIKNIFRIEIAKSLKASYPPIFFEAITKITNSPSTNSAFPILCELSEELTSCFDINSLQLFKNLVEMMFTGRLLTKESYILLQQWLEKEYEKISTEPIASGIYKRTFSGFAYSKTDHDIKYFADGCSYTAKEKQINFIKNGYIVTPILSITYYADSFKNLQNYSRNSFKSELENYLDISYIKLMQALRTLPPSIDKELYLFYLNKIKSTNCSLAEQAFIYYGYLWNAFS